MKNIMSSKEFIKRLCAAATDVRTLYVMGCFGAPLNGSNVSRYTENHTYNKKPERVKMIRAAANTNCFGFDCVCLVKGILWGWTGDASKVYGGAVYGANGVPDVTPEGMLELCSGVSEDFTGIVPGEFLWMPGHCGIYVGNGMAVECTPKWDNRVQITSVANVGARSGDKVRNWTKHGKLPFVDYSEQTRPVEEAIHSGDLVGLSEDAVYYDGAPMPVWVKRQNWYVASLQGDRAIINQNEAGTSAIRSPVSVKFLRVVQAAVPETEWQPAVGDTVLFQGFVHYASADAEKGTPCRGGKAKVTQVFRPDKSRHPYHLVCVPDAGATVHGWVDGDSFVKI